MLIERLIIRKTYPTVEIIRDIPFNLQGLNLIVDKTTENSKDSGNNVGKTTVINIIDLCLGAKTVRKLYFDEDTRSENTEVKNFLQDNKVEAELILIKSKEDFQKSEIKIVRQLFNRGNRTIDDEVLSEDEFSETLKQILFDSSDKRPTLRQLLPKFIRTNDAKTESMIKYLTATSNETYDSIYLFLLSRNYQQLLNEKEVLCASLKACENKINCYSKDNNISSIDILKQRKELINVEIYKYNQKRKFFDYMDIYKDELKKSRELSTDIKSLESKIQMIEFEINLINSNINKLNSEKSNIDTNKICRIYSEAKIYVGELEKTFEDVLNFHNIMIENRIDFIIQQLKNKEEKLDQLNIKRDELLEAKKIITIETLDDGLLDELNCLNNKIEELNIEKGEIKKSLEILEGAGAEKDNLSNGIKKINNQIDSDDITKKNTIFNSFFSNYCEKLYGEKYLFAYDNKWREKKGGFPVNLDSFKGKVGTGMKKSLIVAFDLAYIMFADKVHMSGPQFVIHDKMENTHINQIITIFDICKEIKGQYIIPILRERIDKIDKKQIEAATIIELSKSDKLFRI